MFRIVRPRRLHELWTIAINDPDVCKSVPLFHAGGLCKTAERIDILFVMETPRDPRNIVLDGDHGDSMRPLPNYFGQLLSLL